MRDDIPEPDWGPEEGFPPCAGGLLIVFLVLGLTLQFACVLYHTNHVDSPPTAELQVDGQ